MSITYELDNAEALAQINKVAQKTGDATPLLRDIGEYLMIAHRQRFKDQTAPDGTPWAPLSPRYQKRKKKNANRILYFEGGLADTLRYDPITNNELVFGTNRKYGRLHQLGGQVKREARTRDLYFKQNRDGSVGNRFVKKKKSNFAQTVNVGEHVANYPARPFLGTSEQDNNEILAITQRYLLNLE